MTDLTNDDPLNLSDGGLALFSAPKDLPQAMPVVVDGDTATITFVATGGTDLVVAANGFIFVQDTAIITNEAGFNLVVGGNTFGVSSVDSVSVEYEGNDAISATFTLSVADLNLAPVSVGASMESGVFAIRTTPVGGLFSDFFSQFPGFNPSMLGGTLGGGNGTLGG